MKIAVISSTLPPTQYGESEHTLYLCRHLAVSGAEVHLVTGVDQSVSSDEPFTTHSIIRQWSWKDWPRLTRILNALSPDAVLLMYVEMIYNNHPMITFLPTYVRRRLHIPFVTQVDSIAGHRQHGSVISRVAVNLARYWANIRKPEARYGTLLRDSSDIIVLANQFRDTLEKLVPSVVDKTTLIPPPPLLNMVVSDVEKARQEGRAQLGIEADQVVLAYYGYIYPRKGVEVLLKAFAKVCKKRHDLRLVLIGAVPNVIEGGRFYAQELLDLCANLSISDRVVWTGDYPSDSRLASIYLNAADICVLPYEDGVTFNRSSFSAALAHGLPTITTFGEGMSPPLIDEENVVLCPPGDDTALAVAIEKLLTSPELQQRLRKGASVLSEEWFSWHNVIQKTLSLLQPSHNVLISNTLVSSIEENEKCSRV